jgi:hypothetical protein
MDEIPPSDTQNASVGCRKYYVKMVRMTSVHPRNINGRSPPRERPSPADSCQRIAVPTGTI